MCDGQRLARSDPRLTASAVRGADRRFGLYLNWAATVQEAAYKCLIAKEPTSDPPGRETRPVFGS